MSAAAFQPQRNDTITAPWTQEQVDALNHYQQSGVFHPFTSADTGASLIATKAGWVEAEGGPVIQNWAYATMADRSFVDLYRSLMNGTLSIPISF